MSPWGYLFLSQAEIDEFGRFTIRALRWANTVDFWFAGKVNGVRFYLSRVAEMSRLSGRWHDLP